MSSLTGCSHVAPIRPQLPLPEPTIGPRVYISQKPGELDELKCLNKSVRDRVVQLIKNKAARVKRLRKIIEDHNKRSK